MDSTQEARAVGGSSRPSWGVARWALLLAPSLLLVLVLAVGRERVSGRGVGSVRVSMLTEESGSSSSSSSCDCPALVKLPDCGTTSAPFLGGVDVVEYHSLDDDATGVAGKDEYQTTHNGYTFYFQSNRNLQKFKGDPDKYTPKFGGFCSWAVSGEFCSDGYPWSADCLGPSGNWGVWTLKHGKLFFFLKNSARELFLQDVDANIAAGEERWASWFPDESSGGVTYNTQCYATSADASPSGSMAMLSSNGTSESLASLLSSKSAAVKPGLSSSSRLR